ncbi:carbohydrate ABC transporter permease [Cohnella thermotolerans]|uniref:carbohydrate ABC transporter permease n=1 Tax=Cohnella thermotolerans TaxID=329858 RepID=UPI0003F863ED|nr:carbohydrate ABC transporter permease [Cohnella thermotolerans]
MGQQARKRLIATEWLLAAAALLFMYPLVLAILNSVKTMNDILMHTGSLPRQYIWSNYKTAWSVLNFPRVFLNSLLIDVFSILGVTLFAAMAAYQIVRRPGRFNNATFGLFVASMVIPFHAIMIPLVQVLREFGLINSLFGIIYAYWGLSLAFAVFLFHGFVKALPYEIEEAALIDGASIYSVFFRIVLPLLRPITATVLILNALWIWNDFLLPMILLQGPEKHTIQVAINTMFGQYMKRWDVALPGIVMALAPAVAFFLLLQRHIIEGISSGGIKG